MKVFQRAACLFVITLAAAACESDSEGIIAIDATGTLNGLVYVDRNGNGSLDSQVDGPVANVSVALITPATQLVVARTTTNSTGFYTFTDIPVGRYSLTVETPTLGDSLRVASIDSATITVAAQDTAVAIIALGYQQVDIARLATVPVGRRVIIRGVALNAWAAFGDSTVHIADSTGVLRAVRVVPAAIAAGDTLRLLGTVVNVDNAVTIGDALAFRVSTSSLDRVPHSLTTAEAATADGGTLANDLVTISGATIVNAQLLPNGEIIAAVDDGSGILQVVMDASGDFERLPNIIPGAILEATGLLVARQGGGWQLKPRTPSDIVLSYQQATIAEARTLPAGRLVQLEGLALNAWITFGDSTVHITDPTGSLRATRVSSSTLFAGDSIRLVGRLALRDGQTVLSFAEPTILLANRTLAAPAELTTAAAAQAQGGALDAALARVENAEILDTVTVAGHFILTVDDGSGELEVFISRSLGLALTQYVPGATLNVTGLLVPATGGSRWLLRPRGPNDIAVVTPAMMPKSGRGP